MVRKSYAKVNIFLKIVAKRGNYHEIVSRFVRVDSLYDTISFVQGDFSQFYLEGDFGCKLESNTIYKAYCKLCEIAPKVKEYFKNHKVVVEKNIPEFAGLGGGSSNCATFMNMVNKVCDLGLNKDQLSQIGATIGADVPFFIYEYKSANVTGIGEKVEKFDEKSLDIVTFTPNIQCDTGKIFQAFRESFYKEISKKEAQKLLATNSKEVLENLDISSANDLYQPALHNYPQLVPSQYNLPKKSFFSGSGSSFFYIK